MAVTNIPPQQPPKKSNAAGWGCLGCGCVAVLVLFLLFVGLVAAGFYAGFNELSKISSATREVIAPYTGGEDVYAGAEKKIAAFNADVSASKTSTLTLSSDEVNSLIYHAADLKKVDAQALVTLTGDTGRVQGTIPSNQIPFVNWGVKNRYFNLDATTGVSFDANTKDVNFEFKKVQFGDITVPPNSMDSLQTSFNQQVNIKLHQNADVEKVLQAAKSISIKDGQLVIETK